MDRSSAHDVEFLVLFTASAIVYHQVMEQPLEIGDFRQFNAVLHEVAHALAGTAPIYWMDAQTGKYRRIAAEELGAGAFERGATVLRTPQSEYRNLAIRRTDMRAAIAEFRRIALTFRRAPGR